MIMSRTCVGFIPVSALRETIFTMCTIQYSTLSWVDSQKSVAKILANLKELLQIGPYLFVARPVQQVATAKPLLISCQHHCCRIVSDCEVTQSI